MEIPSEDAGEAFWMKRQRRVAFWDKEERRDIWLMVASVVGIGGVVGASVWSGGMI